MSSVHEKRKLIEKLNNQLEKIYMLIDELDNLSDDNVEIDTAIKKCYSFFETEEKKNIFNINIIKNIKKNK